MPHKILLVDDDQLPLESTRALLGYDYTVICAGPPDPVQAALELWRKTPDLLLALVDLKMPGRDGVADVNQGFDLLKDLKRRERARVAVHSVFRTHENLAQAASSGADGFIGKDWPKEQVLANVRFLADWIVGGSALQAFSRSIELRNPYTAGHSARVRDYCRALICHLPEATPGNLDLAVCLVAAELHDLGKLETPDDILLGPSALTSEQRRIIERHVTAAQSLKHLGLGFDRVADIAYQHHRSYAEPRSASVTDYPKDESLPRGDDRPFEARVLQVADVLDALLSDRPYRPGVDLESALNVIKQDTREGVFDPKVTRALQRLVEQDRGRLEQIMATGRTQDDYELLLFFTDKRLTAGRLYTLLSMLADVYLPEGRSMDRLALKGVEFLASTPDAMNGKHPGHRPSVVVRLHGSKNDIETTAQVLSHRMEELAGLQSRGPVREQSDTVIRGIRPLPYSMKVSKIGHQDPA